jgi:hypothetical protein
MLLWMDLRQRTYGVQPEPGYTDIAGRSYDFVLGKDLQITVADLVAPSTPMPQSLSMAQANPNVPRLRFQPDGLIDPASPQSVVLREFSGESLWITQSRNRLNYEISTKPFQSTFR